MVGRVISKLKRKYNDIIFNTSQGKSLIKQPQRSVAIMYHGIDASNKNPFNARHTPVHYFDKQVRFLTANYSCVSPAEYFDESYVTSKPKCLITFDDGYKNNLQNALPVLLKYNCKATVFITGLNETGKDVLCADLVDMAETLCNEKEIEIGGLKFVKKPNGYYNAELDKDLMAVAKLVKPEYDFQLEIINTLINKFEYRNKPQYDEYWKIMSDGEIKKLAGNSIITIGNHGYYHTNLGAIKPENTKAELINTKQYLENLIQKEIDTLAYPFGRYSRASYEIAQETGHKYQLLTDVFYNGEEDRNWPNITNRAGVYNCDTAANQLIQSINELI
jgi:peptidoglycan/xylan/chitin deacetylase (PgdA/CDA1 family)